MKEMNFDFVVMNRKFNVGIMLKNHGAIVGLFGSYKRLFNFINNENSFIKLTDFIYPIYTKIDNENRSISLKSNLTIYQNSQLEKIINRLLKTGDLIESTNSSQWSSPVYPIFNYSTNQLDIYCDFSELNNLTYDFDYFINDTFTILNSIPPSKLFTKIVLDKSLQQLLIGPTAFKTSFLTDTGKSYEFTTLYNHNLKNTSQFLQMTMENILKDINSIIIYEDQILIYTDDNFKNHFEITKLIFRQLRNKNLKIDIENSYFFYREIKFLDHIINDLGYTVDQTKLTKLLCYPKLKNKYDLNLFIDSIKHFKQYIHNFDDQLILFNNLIDQQSNFEIEWNQDIELAFNNIKIKLANYVPF